MGNGNEIRGSMLPISIQKIDFQYSIFRSAVNTTTFCLLKFSKVHRDLRINVAACNKPAALLPFATFRALQTTQNRQILLEKPGSDLCYMCSYFVGLVLLRCDS